MKRGWIIAIVIIILIVLATAFIIYKKNTGSGFDFGEIDYSSGSVDLEFDGGANTLKNVETNPFRYNNENG